MNKNKIIKSVWMFICFFVMLTIKQNYNLNIWVIAIMTTVVGMLGDRITDKLVKIK
jgi:hypothetical protein